MTILIKNKLLTLMAIAVGSALLVSACGNGGVDAVVADDTNNGVSSVGDAATPDSDEIEVGELPTTVSDDVSDDDRALVLGFVLGDPELHATDPSTVTLASGQIQVIEFFAFW